MEEARYLKMNITLLTNQLDKAHFLNVVFVACDEVITALLMFLSITPKTLSFSSIWATEGFTLKMC
jgi:hypothetical protein